MHRYEVAHILRQIGSLLEIKGEDAFKVRSYERAAESIEQGNYDLELLAQTGRLKEIPGIGPNLEPKIREIVLTGRSSYLDKLTKEVPLGLLELIKVPGIGPKTAWILYQNLNIDGLDALEDALDNHLIQRVPGLGRRREETIARGLSEIKEYANKLVLGLAAPVTDYLLKGFEEVGLSGISVGEVRRAVEAVSSIEILLNATLEDLLKDEVLSGLKEPLAHEDAWKTAWDPQNGAFLFSTNLGVPLKIYTAQPGQFGAASLVRTGPSEFTEWLRDLAQRKGYRLAPDGLSKNAEPMPSFSEEQVFETLGLEVIPPEVRHRPVFWEMAQSGKAIELVELSDIKGDLHVHTNWSDGTATVEQVALKALELGYSYLGITDHATKIRVVRSLDAEKIEDQIAEINRVSMKYPKLRIFTGVEVDILKDGTLLLPNDVLSRLDIVVASIHQDVSGSDYSVVDRLMKAARNPNVDIIGHPTGRFLGRRAGNWSEFEKLFSLSASNGTFLEINAFPERLDLPEELVFSAASEGANLVISTDAHSAHGMEDIVYGVRCCARRAGLSASHIANTRKLEEFLKLKKNCE